MKLISFDLKSDFGFFRKPETNNTLNVSYNMIHKPAILGLLGAVIGLKGYQEKGELPEYYQKLGKLKIGIAPLNHENGNFMKTPIKYSNTVGYANKGTTFLTEELTLITPQYRIYVLLDESNSEQQQLLANLKNGYTEFIPYFGKNEFTAWWDNYREWAFEEAQLNETDKVQIDTLFLKNEIITPSLLQPRRGRGQRDSKVNFFIYFERLPIGFNLNLFQYDLKEFVFTNYLIDNGHILDNLYKICSFNNYVQLI
ncbi:MAG: type I-B CRISPR-associated protein Cas5b [Weeksellaceae bacterium]